MTGDARFEDAGEAPLRLLATDPEDLTVVASLLQDALFPITEIRFDRGRRRLAILLNRFRWEDRGAAERQGRPYERVQTLLVINDVSAVSSQGVNRSDGDLILSLLALEFQETADGAGDLLLVLAGDGALRVRVECLDLLVKDVTRPYRAPSGQAPRHPD
ncbi:MAG: DUF2948 family protein [Qingshengfaniella sp.]